MKEAELNVYLLAGGQSKRMGINKALLDIEGESSLERVLRLARAISPHIHISVSDPAPLSRAGLNVPMVADKAPGQGPLGAIASCLSASDREKNLFLPCDLPFLSEEVLRELLGAYQDEIALCLRSPAGLEPLVGIYHRRALAAIEEALDAGQLGIHRLYRLEGWSHLPLKDEDFGNTWYFNLNTPADMARLKEIRSHA